MKKLVIAISLLWSSCHAMEYSNPHLWVYVTNMLNQSIEISYRESGAGFSGSHTAIRRKESIKPQEQMRLLMANLATAPPKFRYHIPLDHRAPCPADYHTINLESDGHDIVLCTISDQDVDIEYKCQKGCSRHMQDD